MKPYPGYYKTNSIAPPPSFDFSELIYTEEELKKIKEEKEIQVKKDKEYWYARHDPNKGLLYILKNIDEYPNINCNYNKMEIKNIKESGKTLDQISCLPKFCCFMGDGEHYILYNKRAPYNISRDVQLLFNKKYLSK
jgi:hypothetical protein